MQSELVEGIVEENGRLLGVWERPRNLAANSAGSIHEESVARTLGLRGALVSGRTHLVSFAPLLLRAFGPRWWERGTLSIEFRDGTLDQEEVRAVLGVPPAGIADAQVEAHIERPDGRIVARGSAAVGAPDAASWLMATDVLRYDTGEYDLVAHLPPRTVFPDAEITLTREQARRWGTASASLPWFVEDSPWGGPIASPSIMVTALAMPCTLERRNRPIAGVAVDGATELRQINGPVMLERPYHVSATIIGRGHSPRTEFIWYESRMEDEGGRRVAEMRMQLRFMKQSKHLAELAAAGGEARR
jgi:hypothetical protein